MNIGAKIKMLRGEKKVTQEALAEYLHISSQAVSKWETGASSPDIDMLPKLAIFFETSLDNLLDFDQSRLNATIEELVTECGRQCRGDSAKEEAFLRKALEKYPNNDILLNCLLETLQRLNHTRDHERSAEIIEIGERVLACTKDDEVKLDVLRIMAETYHQMGEQAMAEYYLAKLPELYFLKTEVAAWIKSGDERMEEIGKTEDVCIEDLICMLAIRMLSEPDEQKQKAIERQVHEMLDFFKSYPIYREKTDIIEKYWNDGTFLRAFRQ